MLHILYVHVYTGIYYTVFTVYIYIYYIAYSLHRLYVLYIYVCIFARAGMYISYIFGYSSAGIYLFWDPLDMLWLSQCIIQSWKVRPVRCASYLLFARSKQTWIWPPVPLTTPRPGFTVGSLWIAVEMESGCQILDIILHHP